MPADSASQPKKRRGPGRPFQKGQSGNPSGGPKGLAELQALARTYTLDAIEGLANLANHAESEKVRATAWNSLLDRGWGKAAQPIGDGEGGQLVVQVVRIGDADRPVTQ